jgi:hypothetical protein
MSNCPHRGADGASVQVTAFVPDMHLAQLLADRGDPAQILVLPRAVYGDRAVYRDADLTMVKTLRSQGVPIDFLHPATRRTFQSEYSAELVVFFLIFVAEALGEQAVQEMARYLWHSIRNASASGDAPPPQLTVEIRQYVEDGDRRELRGLRISGQDSEQVVSAVTRALRKELPLGREN